MSLIQQMQIFIILAAEIISIVAKFSFDAQMSEGEKKHLKVTKKYYLLRIYGISVLDLLHVSKLCGCIYILSPL